MLLTAALMVMPMLAACSGNNNANSASKSSGEGSHFVLGNDPLEFSFYGLSLIHI